jgi:hypothetical protein
MLPKVGNRDLHVQLLQRAKHACFTKDTIRLSFAHAILYADILRKYVTKLNPKSKYQLHQRSNTLVY